jgi:hypothetical protein
MKAILLSPTIKVLGNFVGLLALLIGLLLTITSTMGPSLVHNPSLCLMKIGAPKGVAQPNGVSAAYFGMWGGYPLL